MENNKGLIGRLAEWGLIRVISEKIRYKILISLLALAIIPLTLLGAVAYKKSTDALMENAFKNLNTLESSRANAVQRYFEKHRSDMRILNETVRSLRSKAFKQLASIQQLKKRLIENYFNERMNDAKILSNMPVISDALTAFSQVKGAVGGEEWKKIEDQYGTFLTQFTESQGYYDVYLVSADGDILYTVAQESDLGENLKNGKLKETSAGKAFQHGLKALSFQDFESYEPAYGDIAAFISAPVLRSQAVGSSQRLEPTNDVIGVIMLQVSLDQINFVMQERTGLGQSGESYLVGPDGFFRSDSIHIEESTVMNPVFSADTKGTAEALAGKTGEGVTVNFRGEYVLSSWVPVKVHDQIWAMLGEIEVTEAFIPREEADDKDFFFKYKEEYGYNNISLINPDGFMFFTVVKGDDYRTNMLTGPYKYTNLGRLTANILENREAGMADFEKYPPFGNKDAAFVAMPLLSESGEVEAVVAAQLSIEQISKVMLDRTGLGETGETYLVGPDKMFRCESAFTDQLGVKTTVMNPNIKVDTVAAQESLIGNKGTNVIKDYRGIQVLSSWSSILVSPKTKVNPDGIQWAVISQIDYEEVNSPVKKMIRLGGVLIFLAVCAVAVLASWLSQSLTVQVRHIIDVIEQIGMGNFEARTPVDTNDELGTMAISLNAMLDNLLSLIRSNRS